MIKGNCVALARNMCIFGKSIFIGRIYGFFVNRVMQISFYSGVLPGAVVILLFFLGYLVLRIFRLNKKSREKELRFQQMESYVNSLQLQTLESRLNPHLFKNILNSIQSHAYQTYFALDKLANVLDYILYESREKLVSPKQEIDFALNLIEINKIKISPLFELKVHTKIHDDERLYQQPLLAPLISIDLIENAFKHADLQSDDAFISVFFEFKDNVFLLTVSNKISGKAPLQKEKGGIGMNTLEQRLRILYKDKFTIDRFTENDIYTARLKIELIEQPSEMFTA